MSARSLDAVILAGGRSSRFGSDKTLAVIDGRTLLERVVASVRALQGDTAVDRVLVVGDHAPDDVELTVEPQRGLGPLAGLAHGLSCASADDVLVLAADHPWLSSAVLTLLIRRHRTVRPQPHGATVIRTATGLEPLVACYRREPTAALADRLLATGERRLHALLDASDVEAIDEREWRALDPDGCSVRDVDRPSDMER